MSVTALTASACAAACSVALLDDGLFLVVIVAVSMAGGLAYGARKLLAAAGSHRP